MTDTYPPISFSLTFDQALVVHELCGRTIVDGQPLRLRNGAEYQTLVAIYDAVGKQLPSFGLNYPELLFAARGRLEATLDELPDTIEPYGAEQSTSVPPRAA